MKLKSSNQPVHDEKLYIRNSPKIRKMPVDSSHPIRIPNDHPSDISRTKLIAPFQKRPPSHERRQPPGRTREPQQPKEHKSMLYDIIKCSIQEKSGIRDRTVVKSRDIEEKPPIRFQSQYKGVKRREENKEARSRFLSRKDYLNISKKRTQEAPKSIQTGSRLKERIQKFLYKPSEGPIAINKTVKKISTYSKIKGELCRKKIKLLTKPKDIPPP